MTTKLWLDDNRPAPVGWYWSKSVQDAKQVIKEFIEMKIDLDYFEDDFWNIKIYLDLDHDLGNDAPGGDTINLLNWIEENDYGDWCVFHIHSMNPVGVENMMRIIKYNGWEVFDCSN